MDNMVDKSTIIAEMKKEMATFVEERKWSKYHQPKELAIALSIESNELLELFLFQNFEIDNIRSNPNLMQSIKEEIADIFAYLLSMVNSLHLDLSEIFQEKMKKNRIKYPISEFQEGNYSKK